MKTFITSLFGIILGFGLMAQAPQSFKYQAIVRDNAGNPLVNKTVSFRITITGGFAAGQAVYSEIHPGKTTNNFGLADLEIGKGTPVTGIFSQIPWAANLYFINVELDKDGGSNYLPMGSSQLLSVPYALLSKNTENNNDLDPDPTNEIQDLTLSGNILKLSKSSPQVTLAPYLDNTDGQTLTYSGSILSISGGNSVTITSGNGGDNWGTQAAITDPTLSGNGLPATPLKLNQQGATIGQALKWDGNSWTPGTDLLGGNGIWNQNGNSIYYNNGNVGIGTTAPAALLHVTGGNVLFAGPWPLPGSPGAIPASGAGSRVMWYADKAAFRAGAAASTEWDAANIGHYSVAFGQHTLASNIGTSAFGQLTKSTGYSSFAAGIQTTASGNYSAAMCNQAKASGYASAAFGSMTTASNYESFACGTMTTASGTSSFSAGSQTTASGNYSTSLGIQTTASGNSSFAAGVQSKAEGDNSTSIGIQTRSLSYREFVIGSSNTIYTPESALQWKPNDRLFVVGNGVGNGVTSDAMVILKNGNIGIGTNSPTQALDVNGGARVRNLSTGVAALPVYATSDGTLVTGGMSDAKLKENIEPLINGMDLIMNLQGVTFNWKADPAKRRTIGFIAQDFEKVIPELVFTNQADGYKGINYAEVTAILVEAVKQLKSENDLLKADNKEIRTRLENLEKILGSNAIK